MYKILHFFEKILPYCAVPINKQTNCWYNANDKLLVIAAAKHSAASISEDIDEKVVFES